MMTVTEISRITGVSVRALHHYDSIGLLPPAEVSPSGYRLYDDASLRRLRTILLLREIQFPLKEIKALLDSPDFDPRAALPQQIRLLEMQRDRLNSIIAFAKEIYEIGADPMNFDAFDHSDIDRYAGEAKSRWGRTDAWASFEQKPKLNRRAAADGLMAILAEIGGMRDCAPESHEVQQLIAALQRHITEHFYPCTDEILSDLGEMYVADDRFRANIDSAGGTGTAQFVRSAIRHFTGK